MKRRISLALLAAGILLNQRIAGQSSPVTPPGPDHYVTDRSGWLSESTRENLEQKLTEFDRQSSCQFIIYIGQSTEGVPIEDWTLKAFEAWKIGKKGEDNGVALFIFTTDRRTRIEVGYGLEGRIPDLLASRIISDILTPGLREGRIDEAIVAAADAIMEAASGRPPPQGSGTRTPTARPKLSAGQIILFALIAIGFLILLITNPSLALYLLFSILSGGRGGGGGGGGFRGGGGRSGGGGASGSW